MELVYITILIRMPKRMAVWAITSAWTTVILPSRNERRESNDHPDLSFFERDIFEYLDEL